MPDATIGIKQSSTPDRLLDAEELVVGATTVYRERVAAPSLQTLLQSIFDGMLLREAVVSSGNSTTTPLAGGATFTGAWEDVLNYASISIIGRADQNSAANGGVVQFSNDGITATRSIAQTVVAAGGGLFFEFGPEARYFRLVYTNGATPQGSFTVQTVYRYLPTSSVELPLGSSINDVSLAAQTRAVTTGKLPSGSYTNARLGGPSTTVLTSTPLLAGATWTSSWESSDGFVSLAVLIVSDVVGAADGISVDFGNDGSTVLRSQQLTYGTAEQSYGSMFFSLPNEASYYRIRYTNGGFNQTSFVVSVRLSIGPLELTRQPISAVFTDAETASATKSVISGKSDTAGYKNVPTNDSGHLKVDIADADAAVPVKALSAAQAGNETSIGTVAPTQIATPALANRKSISVIADPANTGIVYLGFTNSAGACVFPLAAGVSWDGEVDDTVSVYTLGSIAAQNVAWIEVGGTP